MYESILKCCVIYKKRFCQNFLRAIALGGCIIQFSLRQGAEPKPDVSELVNDQMGQNLPRVPFTGHHSTRHVAHIPNTAHFTILCRSCTAHKCLAHSLTPPPSILHTPCSHSHCPLVSYCILLSRKESRLASHPHTRTDQPPSPIRPITKNRKKKLSSLIALYRCAVCFCVILFNRHPRRPIIQFVNLLDMFLFLHSSIDKIHQR